MASAIGIKVISLFSGIFNGVFTAAEVFTGKDTEDHSYQKPSPTDRRSPCPMVNALANHGYLPRDGQNVSLARLVSGAKAGVNLGADAGLLVGVKALQTSSTGNFLTFHLDDLAKHGVIEHDGSLSRKDAQSGDNHTFAPQVWAAVAAHFEEHLISIETAANARKDRLAVAATQNPEYNLTDDGNRSSLIETSLYLGVFGDGTGEGNARTEWVKTLFQEERLPFEEGYKRPDKPLTISDILTLVKKVEAAST